MANRFPAEHNSISQRMLRISAYKINAIANRQFDTIAIGCEALNFRTWDSISVEYGWCKALNSVVEQVESDWMLPSEFRAFSVRSAHIWYNSQLMKMHHKSEESWIRQCIIVVAAFQIKFLPLKWLNSVWNKLHTTLSTDFNWRALKHPSALAPMPQTQHSQLAIERKRLKRLSTALKNEK